MGMYSREALREELVRDEGCRNKPYQDSEGILTVGVGWNLEEHGLPDEIVWDLLGRSVSMAEADLSTLYPDWRELTDQRQRALLNMAFNLGRARLGGFKKMWAAIERGNWQEAAAQALDSKWALQVGPRAQRIAAMLREG